MGLGVGTATLDERRSGNPVRVGNPGRASLVSQKAGHCFRDRQQSILPIPLHPVTTSLTDLQLAIMRVLWDRAEATVVEVQTRLRPERDLAQTTIATLLSRLEKRGVVEHRLDGRQFVYRPLVTEQEVRRSMVSELTTLLFDGRPEALMSHLLRSREMAPGDLDRVKRMIADAETGGGGAHNGAAVFESARPAGRGDAA
jgi:BlaI family transcriptional regulator, penicillinase repressor